MNRAILSLLASLLALLATALDLPRKAAPTLTPCPCSRSGKGRDCSCAPGECSCDTVCFCPWPGERCKVGACGK